MLGDISAFAVIITIIINIIFIVGFNLYEEYSQFYTNPSGRAV
jgi:hypothetical protein